MRSNRAELSKSDLRIAQVRSQQVLQRPLFLLVGNRPCRDGRRHQENSQQLYEGRCPEETLPQSGYSGYRYGPAGGGQLRRKNVAQSKEQQGCIEGTQPNKARFPRGSPQFQEEYRAEKSHVAKE
jgi:hypothetical protein